MKDGENPHGHKLHTENFFITHIVSSERYWNGKANSNQCHDIECPQRERNHWCTNNQVGQGKQQRFMTNVLTEKLRRKIPKHLHEAGAKYHKSPFEEDFGGRRTRSLDRGGGRD